METKCVALFPLLVGYEIKLGIYAGKIMQFQFQTSLIMRVISTSYTNSLFTLFLI